MMDYPRFASLDGERENAARRCANRSTDNIFGLITAAGGKPAVTM